MMTILRPLSRAVMRLRGAGAMLGPALTITAVIGLTACGEPLRPSKWRTGADVIPEGEGLFTGEDGAWEIYRDN